LRSITVNDFRSSSRRVAPFRPLAVLLAACVLGSGCSDAGRPAPDRPLVVVSVVPQRSFVVRLAGDWLDVEVMVPPGASPALYEPTLGQLRALARAALYVKVGHPAFPFERAQLDRLLAEHPDLPVVDGAAHVRVRPGDPHYWLAPEPARSMASSIASALAARFPEHADAIDGSLRSLRDDIDALEARLRRSLDGHRGERFFVFHPGWGYFADAFGLQQVAVEEGHKSPGSRRLGELVAMAREAGVRAIFVQPQFDSRAAEILAGEIGAKVIVLDPLAEDWFGNMERAGRLVAEYAVP
jgi:zinc transport system substrate-binding protein